MLRLPSSIIALIAIRMKSFLDILLSPSGLPALGAITIDAALPKVSLGEPDRWLLILLLRCLFETFFVFDAEVDPSLTPINQLGQFYLRIDQSRLCQGIIAELVHVIFELGSSFIVRGKTTLQRFLIVCGYLGLVSHDSCLQDRVQRIFFADLGYFLSGRLHSLRVARSNEL